MRPIRSRRDQLTIPSYLCGSPKFCRGQGGIERSQHHQGHRRHREEETEWYCPATFIKCWTRSSGRPRAPDSIYSKDPQYQDVVVWQSTDPDKMREGRVI